MLLNVVLLFYLTVLRAESSVSSGQGEKKNKKKQAIMSMMSMMSKNPVISGIMIAGGGNTGSGNYAEMFIPSTGEHCHLPVIPGLGRDAHSTSGSSICGGWNSKHSCISLIDGAWRNTATLQEPR